MGAARPQHKSGSSFLTSGRHCIAAGNGLSGGVAGVAAIVSVRARDARAEVCFRTRVFAFPHSLNSPLSLAFFEQPRTKGGDVVLVCMTPEGGMSADAHVIDNTDGTYTCTYLPVVASPNCKVAVTVNGTHVVGSPFAASVQPGCTAAQATEVFGHGLNDGVAGQKNHFVIQTKDPFGNRCVHSEAGIDHFNITIRPVHSLLPELDAYLRKYTVQPIVTDNEDGTHSVEYTADFAGFYAVEVTLANVPVGDSPYNACICNPTIAFPSSINFEPLPGDASVLLPGAELNATDMVQIHDMIVLLKSRPIELTNNRRKREYLYYYKLTSAMASGKELWASLTLRGTLMPPPLRRHCLDLDQRMVVVAHTDDNEDLDAESEDREPDHRTPLNHLRILDLSDMSSKIMWHTLPLDGTGPNSLDGYACTMWEEKTSVLVSGGVDRQGNCNNDIFMCTLGTSRGAAVGHWRVLQEWPSSIFQGTQFTARANHSMTLRDGTSSFWIFGGRNSDGTLLNDLFSFDMSEEQWNAPQCLSVRLRTRQALSTLTQQS